MPYINRKPKKKRDYALDNLSEKRQFSNKLYHSSGWKSLRLYKLSQQPLCENCEAMNVITLAVDVHHQIKFQSGITDADKIAYFYDYNNLLSVCKKCHYQLDAK
jgi:5-methylcytosine-specific restriction protein A